jgi:endoglucanase
MNLMQRRSLLKVLGLAAGAHVPFGRLLAEQGTSSAPGGVDAFFNQLGYRTGNAKVATVRGAAQGQSTFRLRQAADDKVVFEGPLGAPQFDTASGDMVQQAVFSGYRQPGIYRVEFGGQGTFPLAIGDNAYTDALRVTMRGFTGQRCGCAVDLGHGYQHPPCHMNGAFGATTGKTGTLPNHGGWHDAGDYGRYIVNSGITCGTLLWAWELFPQSLHDLRLGVPAPHGNLPEFLEEVLWNLNWMLQLQEPDGGVFHKQTSDHFCGFIMPQDDHLVSNVIGTGTVPYKSTAATADLAAVMAVAARCYAPYDKQLAERFLTAARKAWTWAVANPNVTFKNPPSIGTGDYGDQHLGDELLWASAELWRTTGEAQYEQAFLHALPAGEALKIEAPSWATVGSLACWTYVLADRPGHAETKTLIRRKTHDAAQSLIERSQSNGYGNTLGPNDYIWGSNGVAGNQSLLLVMDHHFQRNAAVAEGALANLHYLFGRNCWGVSWVTQLGQRPFLHPHHRPSAADNIVAPWPGLLSGGPNRRPGDAVAQKLTPAPPMRMWVDDTGAYSMNEIAINWNAPLVFLLAFANSSASVA